jgi:hypothetical protein
MTLINQIRDQIRRMIRSIRGLIKDQSPIRTLAIILDQQGA